MLADRCAGEEKVASLRGSRAQGANGDVDLGRKTGTHRTLACRDNIEINGGCTGRVVPRRRSLDIDRARAGGASVRHDLDGSRRSRSLEHDLAPEGAAQ